MRKTLATYGTAAWLIALSLASPAGAASKRVVHYFNGGSDGAEPVGNLILVGGKLYGVTLAGGAYQGGSCESGISGCGVVFSVTPAGHERVVHSFGNGSDGGNPWAGLANIGGTLYGTTFAGGANGLGTV